MLVVGLEEYMAAASKVDLRGGVARARTRLVVGLSQNVLRGSPWGEIQ